MNLLKRRQLRDIRIGEVLVFSDRTWAIVEDVAPCPDQGHWTVRNHRMVTLAGPGGRRTAAMDLYGWWDVAQEM